MSHPRRSPSTAAAGFTLLEVTVGLGLLAGFLVMLTQLLAGGVELFDEGETGQELADLGDTAAGAVRDHLLDLTGPAAERYEPGEPPARLLVQWVPLGLTAGEAVTRVQALRGTVRITPVQERALLESALRDAAAAMAGSAEPEEIQARLDELVAQAPRRGRATMLLLPWPQAGAEPGAGFLELRRGLWLPGQRIGSGRDARPLLAIPRLDDGAVGAARVAAATEPVASGLLHFEIAFWSQYTRSFDRGPGDGGPEWVWDSARAGWLSDHEEPARRFGLDLGPDSLEDATDDVYPRAARVTLVVASDRPEAFLAEDLGVRDTSAELLGADRLVEAESSSFLHIGGEWVRYGALTGDAASALRRGQRGTAARAHPRGTPVRLGKTLILFVELAAGRDGWNG